MRVVIAGGHGNIALQLEERLSKRGDHPVGIIRNPDHASDLEGRGAEPAVLDLEKASVDELATVVEGADAVVFAAGGGPGSGVERKETVDKGAAIKLADAATKAGVRRYVMISSMGTDQADPTSEDVFQVYLRAKAAADEYLRSTDLDWTIIQPGGLTDDAGNGQVTLDPSAEPREIPRADVARAVAAALDSPATIGKQVTLLSGPVPVEEAFSNLP
jgi:uncharacterized protein YbjT (DUF2867 family)